MVDEDRTVYPQYGATRTPHVFLLDNDLTVQYIGAIDDNAQDPEAVSMRYVANAIDALEKGKKPIIKGNIRKEKERDEEERERDEEDCDELLFQNSTKTRTPHETIPGNAIGCNYQYSLQLACKINYVYKI